MESLGYSWSLLLAGLSIAFRMAPLLAITTELVNPSERGTFLALRNALSQLGIAASTLSASYLFFRLGVCLGWAFLGLSANYVKPGDLSSYQRTAEEEELVKPGTGSGAAPARSWGSWSLTITGCSC